MSTFGGSQQIGAYHIALGADANPALRAVEELKRGVEANMAGIRASTFGLAASMGSLATGFIAIGAAAVAAYGVMSAAVERHDKVMRALNRSTGGAMDTATYEQFADRLADASGRSENSVLKLSAQIASLAGVSDEPLQRMTTAAIGLAAQFDHLGLDAEGAGRLLAAAYGGDFSGAKALGIELRDLASGQDKFNRLLSIGENSMGEAEKNAVSTAGGWARLKDEAENLARAIGETLDVGADGGRVFQWMGNHIERLGDRIRSLKPWVVGLRESLKDLLGIGGQFGSLGDLFNFDAAMVQAQRLFQYLKSEITILLSYAREGLVDTINELVEAMPSWMRSVVGAPQTGSSSFRTNVKDLQEMRQQAVARLVEHDAANPEITAQDYKDWKGFGFEPKARKAITDIIADIDRQLVANQKMIALTTPDDLLKHKDAGAFAEQQRTAQRALDAELKKQVAAMNFSKHFTEIAGSGALASLLPSLKIANDAQRYADGMKGQLAGGVDPYATGRPQTIQTAIGDLAIPGVNESQRIAREHVKATRDTNAKLDRLIALAEEVGYVV